MDVSASRYTNVLAHVELIMKSQYFNGLNQLDQTKEADDRFNDGVYNVCFF